MMIPMIDYLSATINIQDYENTTKLLLEELEHKKNDAKFVQKESLNEKVFVTIGDKEFYILSNGSKGYAYILHNDFYEIRFAQYRSENEDFYPIFIKIKAECLWSISPFEAWLSINKWLNQYIGKVLGNKINRIDLCCHTDELNLSYNDIEKFRGKFDNQELFSNRRKVTGYSFGSRNTGKIFCRIYDKVAEIKKKKRKLWFYQIWKENGLDSECVWNVEFEINRKFLSEYLIETVEDAFQRLKSLWGFCTCQWLLKINLDNSRRERCSINEKWIDIQSAFDEFESKPLIKRTIQLDFEAASLVPGAIGNITSYAARKGITNIDSILSMLKYDGNYYLKKSKKTTFENNVEEKMKILNEERGIVNG